MSFSNIKSALIQSWIDGGFLLPTGYENRVYEPVAGEEWAQVFIVHAQPENLDTGTLGQDKHNGFMQVNLNYPLNEGDGTPLAKASAIAAYYRAGRVFSYGGQDVTIQSAGITQGVNSSGWFQIILTVYWYSYVTRI